MRKKKAKKAKYASVMRINNDMEYQVSAGLVFDDRAVAHDHCVNIDRALVGPVFHEFACEFFMKKMIHSVESLSVYSNIQGW